MRDGAAKIQKARFDLGDLGLLDGGTEREFEIITRNAGVMLQGSAAFFCVLDDARSSVFMRSRFLPRGGELLPDQYARSDSMFAQIIERDKSVRIVDLGEHPEFDDTFEPSVLPFKSVLAEPVYGPAREPIGALLVLCSVPRKWAELERIELRDQAHLLSRQVLLRATLETLKRMSQERTKKPHAHRFHN